MGRVETCTKWMAWIRNEVLLEEASRALSEAWRGRAGVA